MIIVFRGIGKDKGIINQVGNLLFWCGADVDLLEIPGVGKTIAERIDELLSTGQLGFYDKLTAEVPITLVELHQIRGVDK
jgi:DNA polymerase/3'-5' exonuclease PolX